MSDIVPMIDTTESWLTRKRKQVQARLRPKCRYSLCDPRSPEDHQQENVRIGRLAWTSCDERVGFERRAGSETWNHVDMTMAHPGYAKTRERAGQLLRRRYARMVREGEI